MRECDYSITNSDVWLNGTKSRSFSTLYKSFKFIFPLDPNGIFFLTFGLNSMDTETKQKIGEKLQKELEIRVGDAIAASCTSEQLSFFNNLMEDDFAVIDFLDTLGDYHEDAFFKRYMSTYGKEGETIDNLRNYATLKWLPQNVPDYKKILKRSSAYL